MLQYVSGILIYFRLNGGPEFAPGSCGLLAGPKFFSEIAFHVNDYKLQTPLTFCKKREEVVEISLCIL